VDLSLFIDVIQGSCDYARSKAGRVDARFVNALIDLLLHGATHRPKSNSKLRSRQN
jgi:hypothetical protein